MRPRSVQEGPRSVSGASQERPSSVQERTRSVPGASQERPGATRSVPGASQMREERTCEKEEMCALLKARGSFICTYVYALF